VTATADGLVAGQDLDALRSWVNGLPAYTATGVECTEMSAGLVRGRMVVDPRLLNPSGAVNGGVLSFFADQLGGAVASTLVPTERGPVTASLTLNYLAAATGERLDGLARVVRAGRSLAFVEMEVRAGDRLCVAGSGVWFLTAGRA
jgi:uncharacterized protein (TIGR00369 family)